MEEDNVIEFAAMSPLAVPVRHWLPSEPGSGKKAHSAYGSAD